MEIVELLEAVRRGDIAPEAAAESLRRETDLGFAVVDDARGTRTGCPEVVYGQGKTPEQIVALVEHLAGRDVPALVTRISDEAAAAVRAVVPGCHHDPMTRLLWRLEGGGSHIEPRYDAQVQVVCAGTSDLPVAEEAAKVAELFGLRVGRTTDVGVAGLHRLLSRLDTLREAKVLIVVAGMEGALPSVVAGLVSAPIIAVPTSVGYGANLGGLTAMLGMATGCSGGLAVVNVNNGFGAAHLAHRIVRTFS